MVALILRDVSCVTGPLDVGMVVSGFWYVQCQMHPSKVPNFFLKIRPQVNKKTTRHSFSNTTSFVTGKAE
jgi:hypothetical protein